MKKIIISLVFTFLVTLTITAQNNMGIGTPTPDASAKVDISSTTQGFLMPRLSTGEMNAIAAPATGLLVFNNSINQLQVNTGTPAAPVWSSVLNSKQRRLHPVSNAITWQTNDEIITLQPTHSGSIVFPSASANTNKIIGINNRSGSVRPIANTTGGDTGVYADEFFTSIAGNGGICLFISDGISWRLHSGRP